MLFTLLLLGSPLVSYLAEPAPLVMTSDDDDDHQRRTRRPVEGPSPRDMRRIEEKERKRYEREERRRAERARKRSHGHDREDDDDDDEDDRRRRSHRHPCPSGFNGWWGPREPHYMGVDPSDPSFVFVYSSGRWNRRRVEDPRLHVDVRGSLRLPSALPPVPLPPGLKKLHVVLFN